MNEDLDVVIVGAGIAGLSAALELTAAGLTVALLEASDGCRRPGCGPTLSTGWRLDRGFQVHDTAYPTLASLLDADALQLQEFTPGAVLHRDGKPHRVVDPRRRPLDLLNTATSPVGSLKDKAAIGLLAARDRREPGLAACSDTRRRRPMRR